MLKQNLILVLIFSSVPSFCTTYSVYWLAYCWQIICVFGEIGEEGKTHSVLVVTSRHEKSIIDKIMRLKWTPLIFYVIL